MNEYEKTLNIDFRKDFGIFYSPNILTNYIIGECLESYFSNQGFDLITLQQITILDCSCGAGAFLLETFDFLLKKYQNYFPNFPEPEKWIIENNLFGVDIDENAVEICKRQFFEKSGFEIQNIKIGNSLIEDKNIDEKAFVWKNEFPLPFKKGGFDLIVGNPPYVDIKTMNNIFAKYYFKTYETTQNRINLYAIFIEKALSLLSKDGILSFIIPNSILVNSSYLKIREKLHKGIEKIIKLPDNVFEGANVETIIFKYFHNKQIDFAKALIFSHTKKIEKIEENEDNKFKIFDKKNWNGKFLSFNIYASNEIQTLIRKCFDKTESLDKYFDFSLGITPYDKYKGHSENTIKNREFHSETKKDNHYKPCISGQNITRFSINESITEYIKYGDWLGAKREERFFTEPRIIVRQILSGNPPKIYAAFTDKSLYFTQIGFSILPKNDNLSIKYILALLNSKLINFVHTYKFTDVEKEIFSKILIENARILPIKIISKNEQQIFIDKVNEILNLQPQLRQLKNDFLEILQQYNTKNKEYSKKLENWFTLDWVGFVKELEKAKIEMSLKVKKEWLEMFKDEKLKINSIAEKIEILDKEIDNLVYQLYELNEEEIKIIENE